MSVGAKSEVQAAVAALVPVPRRDTALGNRNTAPTPPLTCLAGEMAALQQVPDR